jgi:D-alanine-D-alanine ligase
VPPGIFIEDAYEIDTEGLNFPLFVKPCFEDASIGIDKESFVRDEEDLRRSAAVKLKNFPRGLVAEEFIPGKEFAVGMIGNSPYEVLGISVLDYAAHDGAPSFLTYDSKWISNAPEFKKLMPTLDAQIPEGIRKSLLDIARKTAEAFKCRGYCRIDTRERDGKVYVLDVNPNPDISEDSGFMRMAFKRGYSYESMLYRIIELASEK